MLKYISAERLNVINKSQTQKKVAYHLFPIYASWPVTVSKLLYVLFAILEKLLLYAECKSGALSTGNQTIHSQKGTCK